jgi:hypothetical protein
LVETLTAWEELTVVLVVVWAVGALWLVLDLLLGRSKGANYLRTIGFSTLEIAFADLVWPFFLVLPWLAAIVVWTYETARFAKAVFTALWDDTFGNAR